MSLPKTRTSPIAFLFVAAFCGYGLLATLEPNPPVTQWTWRALYSVIGVVALAGVASSFRRRSLRLTNSPRRASGCQP